jgi:hypothetical protein
MVENVWVNANDDDINIFKNYHWKPVEELKVERSVKRSDSDSVYNDKAYASKPQVVSYLYWDKSVWEMEMKTIPYYLEMKPVPEDVEWNTTWRWDRAMIVINSKVMMTKDKKLIQVYTKMMTTKDKKLIKVTFWTKNGSKRPGGDGKPVYGLPLGTYEDKVFAREGSIMTFIQWVSKKD